MHETTEETGSTSWSELLSPSYSAATLTLCLGVALFAFNGFLVSTSLPTAVREIGGLRADFLGFHALSRPLHCRRRQWRIAEGPSRCEDGAGGGRAGVSCGHAYRSVRFVDDRGTDRTCVSRTWRGHHRRDLLRTYSRTFPVKACFQSFRRGGCRLGGGCLWWAVGIRIAH